MNYFARFGAPLISQSWFEHNRRSMDRASENYETGSYLEIGVWRYISALGDGTIASKFLAFPDTRNGYASL